MSKKQNESLLFFLSLDKKLKGTIYANFAYVVADTIPLANTSPLPLSN